jgi:hypothetical protein
MHEGDSTHFYGGMIMAYQNPLECLFTTMDRGFLNTGQMMIDNRINWTVNMMSNINWKSNGILMGFMGY